ncbi:hypothetical protein JCM21900_006699 [Sporobolomyces salmonicolor]
MAEGGWTPLGNQRAGMIVVAVAANLSVLSIVLLSTYIAWLLWQHSRKSPAEKVEGETRAIKFLTSSHGMLFLQLIFGDFLQALGFMLNYDWVARDALPPAASPTALCTAQGVLIQIGDLGSGFSSLFICVNLFIIIVAGRQPPLAGLWAVMAFQWIVIAILAMIGPRWLERDGVPFYGPAGGWCWISAIYQAERLWLHYFWVFTVAFLDLVLYAVLASYLYWTARAAPKDLPGTSAVARVMLLFPLTYIITILPLSTFRASTMAGKHWPAHVQLAAGAIFTLAGTADCIIYATTRRIISFDKIGSALRRGSGSVTGGIRERGLAAFFKRRPNPPASSQSVADGVRVDVDVDVYLPGLSPAEPSPFDPDYASFASVRPPPDGRQKQPYQVQWASVGQRPFQSLTRVSDEGTSLEGEKELDGVELRPVRWNDDRV